MRIGDPIADTAVREGPAGRFVGSIPPSWQISFSQGGITLMAALQATRRIVGDDLELICASAVFTKPLHCSTDFVVGAELLRAARGASYVSADLTIAESNERALRLHGVYGQQRESPAPVVERSFPEDIPAFSSCPEGQLPSRGPLADIWKLMPFWHQFDWRPAIGLPIDSPDLGGRAARNASWIRFKRTPRRASGLVEPLAYCCLGDVVDSYFQAAGLSAFMVTLFTMQIDVQWFGTTDSDWVLQHGRTIHAKDGYLHAEVELWDPEKRLLAVVSQRALMK
jgi:acyl-CoA thioesterase